MEHLTTRGTVCSEKCGRIFGNLALIKEKFSFYLLLFIVWFQLRLIVTKELKVLVINFCKNIDLCQNKNLCLFSRHYYIVGGVINYL